MRLFTKLTEWERGVRAHYNTDLSTPEKRRRAHIYNLWFDHAILRGVWTNFSRIAPGVYRSNHPTHRRFAKMKDMGITTVLNLRGSGGAAHYLTEEESCAQLGLKLVSVRLLARKAASRKDILGVIAAMREIDKPLVLHCKSGADRAGFASAIYLMVFEGEPVERARRMLGPRYAHIRWSRTGVLDYILDRYAERNARAPIEFEDWIAREYDAQEMQAGFDALKVWQR